MASADNRFREFDTVADQDGHTGIVVSCRNHRTGESFLSVRVTAGPRKGQWDKLYRYTPQLDHPGGTVATTCLDCGRVFLAAPRVLADLGGRVIPQDEHCRTCLPAGKRELVARALTAESATASHDRLHRPWRDRERTEPVSEPGERRPKDDPFRDTPF